jgi:DNA helicase HerA-like ATPase
VLAQLDPKQQALILGYAVPMPVVVKTRPFDAEFYKAVSYTSNSGDDLSVPERKARATLASSEVFGTE